MARKQVRSERKTDTMKHCMHKDYYGSHYTHFCPNTDYINSTPWLPRVKRTLYTHLGFSNCSILVKPFQKFYFIFSPEDVVLHNIHHSPYLLCLYSETDNNWLWVWVFYVQLCYKDMHNTLEVKRLNLIKKWIFTQPGKLKMVALLTYSIQKLLFYHLKTRYCTSWTTVNNCCCYVYTMKSHE